MKFTLFVLTILLVSSSIHAQERVVTELSKGWKFSKGKKELAFQKDFKDANWETVSVPHDWAIYGPFDKEVDIQTTAIVQNGEKVATEKTGRTGALPYIGEAWYRNQFSLPNFDKSKKVLIVFEGAMSEPKVFVNGKKVGEWNYGYNYFYFDITDFVA